MNSNEFQAEMEKTSKFVNKVYDQFEWVPNPNEEVNEGVTIGLARNKLIYGKRFCPFIVYGHSGSRSFQIQHAMKGMGFEKVGNLRPGIIGYAGEVQKD